ncbi:MAG: aminopeptidase [Lachnospiraceae bacterium]|nr:aminopeptidase [Lachnospiraceae bacterium]
MINERYVLVTERIRGISSENLIGEPFCSFFARTASLLILLDDVYKLKSSGGLYKLSMDELKDLNGKLYEDIAGDSYRESFTNPSFITERIKKAGYDPSLGRLLAFLAAEMRALIPYAFEGNEEILLLYMELFVEVYCLFTAAGEDSKCAVPDSEEIRQHIYWFMRDNCEILTPARIREQLDPSLDHAVRMITDGDLNDLRYLYYFGEYITEDELKTAAFLNSLSDDEVKAMAHTYTEGYRIGFEKTVKDISKKKTVNIRFTLGFERMIREAIQNFKQMGLEPVIYRASELSINKGKRGRVGYYGAIPNRQYDYDHREDEAAYLDRDYVNRKLDVLRFSYEDIRELAASHAGPACVEDFGQEPFLPEKCDSAFALSEKQRKLSVEYADRAGRLTNEFIPGDERSFTIIAYPRPCIGDDFEEIFKETVKLNTLDYKKYEAMQQVIIDVLDKASLVRITGREGNETDITVSLNPLKDPEHETNFENCVADVNIPLGEVFTTPKLKGTGGLLHVKQVYLNELKYIDLRLGFKNGIITDYSCGNFDDEKLNKKYIEDNLLFHHKTLPMGEFAIGTNTTAYRMARRFNIERLLPILIGEKTGPHFAVGDTCYSYEEDLESFNPDGKAIVARSNDYSDLRDSEPDKAYFHCHTDITIPYDELGGIYAVMPDSTEIAIIKDGLFVLPGLEEINKPLREEL